MLIHVYRPEVKTQSQTQNRISSGKKQLQTQAEPKGRVLDLLEGKQLTPEEETKALRQRANERTLVNWYAVGLADADPPGRAGGAVLLLVAGRGSDGGAALDHRRHRYLPGFPSLAHARQLSDLRPGGRWTLALLGGLAGEGTATDWVSNHRQHHALSDKPGDPHSPRDGAWWSHIW